MAILMNKRFFYSMVGIIALVDDGTKADNTIKIYKGTMPADADSYDPANPIYTGDELATFTNFTVSPQAGTTRDDPLWGRAKFTDGTGLPTPSTVNATQSGTAAWYAMYNTATLNRVIIGDVTLAAGTGSIFLDSLSLTNLAPTTIIAWGIILKA